jgi:hypothetical protein
MPERDRIYNLENYVIIMRINPTTWCPGVSTIE